MSYPGKLGKHLPSEGQQAVWSSVQLALGGLTAMLMPAGGISGATTASLTAAVAAGSAGLPFTDIYSISLTSDDTTVNAVTLSDGVNSVTWRVGTSPVGDSGRTPYRMAAGAPLFVSANAVTSGKTINVAMRGVVTRT